MIRNIVYIIISGFSIVTVYFMVKAFILDIKERKKLDLLDLLFLLLTLMIIFCNVNLIYKVWVD